MSYIAVRTENLGKLYRIGEHQRGYKTLRETIVNTFSSPFRHLCRNPQSTIRNRQSDSIWALKGISFEVKRGEVIGIIGRNGAGKTTLLRILSRITEPTEGWAEIRGRVGSLLEVGTGFHPELTGRENIYLNGAILGMKKAEIDRKFDEIVDFAEIEKFIDTPVKRYSSGMHVRLAFAVAAHLEPEILLVDEVLAVGDAAFQKKCLGKMGNVAQEGRTVLFVSHSLGAVRSLCRRAVLLEEGQKKLDSPVEEVIGGYLFQIESSTGEIRWSPDDEDSPVSPEIRLEVVRLLNSKGQVQSTFGIEHPIQVCVEYEVLKPLFSMRIGIQLLSAVGDIVFATTDEQAWAVERPRGRYTSVCTIPRNFLNTGQYHIAVGVGIKGKRMFLPLRNVINFTVAETTTLTTYGERWPGIVRPDLRWEVHANQIPKPEKNPKQALEHEKTI